MQGAISLCREGLTMLLHKVFVQGKYFFVQGSKVFMQGRFFVQGRNLNLALTIQTDWMLISTYGNRPVGALRFAGLERL